MITPVALVTSNPSLGLHEVYRSCRIMSRCCIVVAIDDSPSRRTTVVSLIGVAKPLLRL